jgi:hypothetical protein
MMSDVHELAENVQFSIYETDRKNLCFRLFLCPPQHSTATWKNATALPYRCSFVLISLFPCLYLQVFRPEGKVSVGQRRHRPG